MGEQVFLALQSPTITAQALIFTNHAVTGDYQRHWIRGTCTSLPRGLLSAVQLPAPLRRGTCAAVRYLSEALPKHGVESRARTSNGKFEMGRPPARC